MDRRGMRETDRTPDEQLARDDLLEGPVLWTSEQKINPAMIFSYRYIVSRTKMYEDGTEANHGVARVGKEGPTTPVDFLNNERIRDESRFLF